MVSRYNWGIAKHKRLSQIFRQHVLRLFCSVRTGICDVFPLTPGHTAHFGRWYDCCVSDELFIAQCPLYSRVNVCSHGHARVFDSCLWRKDMCFLTMTWYLGSWHKLFKNVDLMTTVDANICLVWVPLDFAHVYIHIHNKLSFYAQMMLRNRVEAKVQLAIRKCF